MSALCQKRTFCAAAELALFDHLVGARKDRLRNRKPERLSRLEVDGQLIFGRCLHWKVRGLFAFKDAIDVTGGAMWGSIASAP